METQERWERIHDLAPQIHTQLPLAGNDAWEKRQRRREREEDGEGAVGTARAPRAAGAESGGVVPELRGPQSLHLLFPGGKTPSQDLGWSRRKPSLGFSLGTREGCSWISPVSPTPKTFQPTLRKHRTRHRPEETSLIHPPSESAGIKKKKKPGKRKGKEIFPLVP